MTEETPDQETQPASAALEVHRPAAPALPPVPMGAELNGILQIADVLATSALVPRAYFRKPENIVLATLLGRAFGWDPTMAMRSVHIIEGQPSLKPEIMLALVRAHGHSVSGESTAQGATITGVRADTGDKMTTSFTMDDAKRAKLDNKDNWKKYPDDMCWARALAKLCRRLFPDVVLGAGYTADELGATVNADGDVIDMEPVDVPWEQKPAAPQVAKCNGVKVKLRKVFEAAGDDRDTARGKVLALWSERGLPEGADATMPVPAAKALVDEVTAANPPAEAAAEAPAAEAPAAPAQDDGPQDATIVASPKQVQRIKILQRECGIDDADYRAMLADRYEAKSSKELTDEQARELIAELDERRKTAMPEGENPWDLDGEGS